MSNERYFCPSCDQLTMRIDDDGYYRCDNCGLGCTEEDYEELEHTECDFEKFDNVYDEIYILGEQLLCPHCGHPILDKRDGFYICNWSKCGAEYSAQEILDTVRSW